MNQMMTKSFSEMMTYNTYLDRFNYLRLDGIVGNETFGHDRYLNQLLYHSGEWKRFRRKIIIRDNACDLGCDEYEIPKGILILIHHINPYYCRRCNK